MAVDVYPFSDDKAILFIYGRQSEYTAIPPEIRILRDVTDDPEYKNRALASSQRL